MILEIESQYHLTLRQKMTDCHILTRCHFLTGCHFLTLRQDSQNENHQNENDISTLLVFLLGFIRQARLTA